ncbi:MAG: DUF4335 domain-containing protein [Merismopedia sp. SIO2A8]|nr:DUF4335 domain-containing protein [Symploca sp. SIO2B6]NET50331.1 DUF4335 domain-containing protein [Merismopedia sp. SIO2A8]
MTIQRQYSLPNCRLVLEGWEDTTGEAVGGRPLLSMITNMECHFSGYDKPLTGGQELLDNLVRTVSRYVQEVLSGITRPAPPTTKSVARVQLQSMGGDLHRLTVNQAASGSDPSKYQVDLKTIQLFDLVEVMDQLVADVQTLPQLAVDLSPLPKRYVATQEPVTEKLMPATIGISSLAAAAIALFLIPVPEVMPPEVEPRPVTEEQVPGSNSNGLTPDSSPGSAPGSPPENTPENTPESDNLPENGDVENGDTSSNGQTNNNLNTNGLNGASNAIPSTSSSTDRGVENRQPQPSTSQADSDQSEARQITDTGASNGSSSDEIDQILGSAQPISDPDQLNELTLSLRDRVDRSWKRPEDMDEDLVYRVGISDTGVLIGFKAINDAAKDEVDTVPLRQLDTVPLSPETSAQLSVGQFRVVFRTTGVVEVSPWYGRLPE